MSLSVYLNENNSAKVLEWRHNWDESTKKAGSMIGLLPMIDEYYSKRKPEPVCLYSDNITHNLGSMATEAGIYEALWRPDEIGITNAYQLIVPLMSGLAMLVAKPDIFKAFNSANGWGMYEHFVPFVRNYLNACIEYPNALVEVSR